MSESLVPVREPPPIDVNIDIEVQCPLEIAPIQYLENVLVPNFDFRFNRMKKSQDSLLSSRRDHKPELVLKTGKHSPVSFKNRSDSILQYVIRSTDFD
jgi:hypothetical protein